MTTLPLLILSAALQAAPAPADTTAAQPVVKGQDVKSTAETPATSVSPAGLDEEVGKLIQLQDEIRAILNAGLPPGPKETGQATVPAAPIRIAGDTPDALAAADALYCLGRYSEALSLYDRATPAGKEDTCWVLFQKANSLRWMGKDDAVAVYQQVIGEYPDNFLAAEAEWWLSATQWKKTFREN